MADTLAINIAESTQEIIDTTTLMLPVYSPMVNLVTRKTITKGHDSIELPYVNTFPTVETPTEGDELVNTSQFDLASVTINPIRRVIRTRITSRAKKFSKEELVSLISTWIGRAQAVNADEDLIAEFTNFGSGNDIGTTNTDMLLAVIRTGKRLLESVAQASGGPAPDPIFTVLSPIAAENLMTDLGVQGVVASTSPWIPEGMSENLIKKWMTPTQYPLLGTLLFKDANISNDGSGDHICGMFSKDSLFFATSEDWDMDTFKESNWDGIILRTIADFNSGVHGYSLWGAQITADGI